MNTENQEAKRKSRLIWGWILLVIGVLITLWGLYKVIDNFLYYVFSNVPAYDPFCEMRFVAGIPLLMIGWYWLIRNRKGKTPIAFLGSLDNPQGDEKKLNTENKEVKGKSNRILGWILTIFGGLFILFNIIWLCINGDGDIGACLPELGIGIWILIFGIWFIILKGKTPPENISGVDNPQGELKR